MNSATPVTQHCRVAELLQHPTINVNQQEPSSGMTAFYAAGLYLLTSAGCLSLSRYKWRSTRAAISARVRLPIHRQWWLPLSSGCCHCNPPPPSWYDVTHQHRPAMQAAPRRSSCCWRTVVLTVTKLLPTMETRLCTLQHCGTVLGGARVPAGKCAQ
jgi:hypothetical protein